jgi:hypothetical protein
MNASCNLLFYTTKLGQAMKYLVYTTASGRVGPVLAILAEKRMDEDACNTVEVPGGHFAAGGRVVLCVCHSRAGNAGMWKVWMNMVHEWLVREKQIHEEKGMHEEWSTDGYTTLDGEHGQLKTILTPAIFEKFTEIGHTMVKTSSACSLVFQPNDLMKSHKFMHQLTKEVVNSEGIVDDGVYKWYLKTAVAKLWPDDSPTAIVNKQYATLISAFCTLMSRCWGEKVVRKGHEKAGQGEKKLDFLKMAHGMTIDTTDKEMMAAFEGIAVAMTPQYHATGQASEADFDKHEPTNPLWSTLSKQERRKRKEGTTGLARDERTMCQRRSVVLTSEKAIAARLQAAREQEEYAAAQKDEKAGKAREDIGRKDKTRKIVAMQNEKKKAEKVALTKAAVWSSQLDLIATKSLTYAEPNDEECICLTCGISYACAEEHGPNMPDSWKEGWMECDRSGDCKGVVFWCPECRDAKDGIHIHRHDMKVHAKKIKDGHANRIKKQETKVDKAMKAAAGGVSIPATLPDAQEAVPLVLLGTPPHFDVACADLLNKGDFHTFCEQILDLDGKEFSLGEFTEIKHVEQVLLERLDSHIKHHPQITKANRTSYAFDYARQNCSRMLALKILLGQVPVASRAHDADGKYTCYLSQPSSWTVVNPLSKEVIFGGYVVAHRLSNTFKRSGKAIDVNKRVRDHGKDKDKDSAAKSKFYMSWRHKWGDLEWYYSLALNEQQKLQAASVMYVSPDVKSALTRAKWSGAKKKWEERAHEMMAYLSELIDDLLMDSHETATSSEMPGFEGPLGTYVPKNTM